MIEFEETEGFVNFPPSTLDNVIPTKNKTLVYLVAFDWSNVTGGNSILSNIDLNINADLISDDVNGISQMRSNSSIKTKSLYEKDGKSTPLVTSICLGWCENSFKIKQDESEIDWFCTFRDLTNEGRKLYYSIKKLHNNKEIRILTFNSVRKRQK